MTAAEGDANAIAACKGAVKEAIAAALGKTAGDMTDSDFEENLQKGAQHKMVETSRGCMEAATTATNITECDDLTAKAMASGLGKTITASRRAATPKANDPNDKATVAASKEDAAASDAADTI